MAEISYGHKRELYRVVVKAMLDKDGHKHFPKYTSEGLVVVYILSKVTYRVCMYFQINIETSRYSWMLGTKLLIYS